MGERIALARQQSGAEKLKGHDIMALERFDPQVRHWLSLMCFLLNPPVGDKGDKKLIETMKYKPETPEQAAARTEAQAERIRENAAGWLDSAVLAPLKRAANDEMHMEAYAVLREEFLSGVPGSVEQLSAFKKSVTGRVIPKSERDRLEIFERMLSGMQDQEPPQIGVWKRIFIKTRSVWAKSMKKTAAIGKAIQR